MKKPPQHDSEQMHSILMRQLRKTGLDVDDLRKNPQLFRLLQHIDASYKQWDRDRSLLERSLLLTSEEMSQLYEKQRVEALEERREANARNRMLVEAINGANEMIIITDVHGAIEYVNPAFSKITGYNEQETLGNNPRMLNSGKQTPEFYRELWQTITSGRVWRGSIVNRCKDGRNYPAIMSITPIRNEEGDTVNYIGVQQDMSEYKTLEAQFIQAQKMESIGTLVGGIAHDFNNMLGGIIGNTFLAKRKAQGEPELLRYLGYIDELANQSSSMVKQLLAFARKGMIEQKPLQVGQLCDKMLSLVRISLPENIDFRYLYDSNAPLTVYGDATQLQQVLINLLNNARDAVHGIPRPEITLRVHSYHADEHFHHDHPELQADYFVHIAVQDNGCGIDKANLAQVFDPFFSTKEVGKGTGLGLAMCYGTVQSHGGTICVESARGKGSTFHLYLPLLEQPEQQNEAANHHAPGTMEGGNGEWILLADDADRVREPCAEMLEDIGYTVLQAADGEQAQALFSEHQDRIALAILDVVMPHCGGPELANKLRAIKPDLPVLFATGYDRQHVLQGVKPEEHCTVLTKPYAFDQLAQIVRQHLQPTTKP